MRVAIIDVGANTLRLLVAAPAGHGLQAIHEERVQLGLGAEVERYGYITAPKCARAAEVARAQVRRAWRLGCERVEIVVTSPGRQSGNGDEFAAALERATGVPTRILTAEEEGALAWEGAVVAFDGEAESIAVCDVGGGSTQVVVGTRQGGPAWAQSIDLGSRRLTERLLTADPPGAEAVEAARAEVATGFAALVPPVAQVALATGGTARALHRIVDVLDGDGLAGAIEELAALKRDKIAKRFSLPPQRAATLLAGAILFAEAHQRLTLPFELAGGGVREGCALASFQESVSAYA